MVFLMYQSTQQFYTTQINTNVLVSVYCVEVLQHVATRSHNMNIPLVIGLFTDMDAYR
jgi:preprotein translocase subunit SecF